MRVHLFIYKLSSLLESISRYLFCSPGICILATITYYVYPTYRISISYLYLSIQNYLYRYNGRDMCLQKESLFLWRTLRQRLFFPPKEEKGRFQGYLDRGADIPCAGSQFPLHPGALLISEEVWGRVSLGRILPSSELHFPWKSTFPRRLAASYSSPPRG